MAHIDGGPTGHLLWTELRPCHPMCMCVCDLGSLWATRLTE